MKTGRNRPGPGRNPICIYLRPRVLFMVSNYLFTFSFHTACFPNTYWTRRSTGADMLLHVLVRHETWSRKSSLSNRSVNLTSLPGHYSKDWPHSNKWEGYKVYLKVTYCTFRPISNTAIPHLTCSGPQSPPLCASHLSLICLHICSSFLNQLLP